MPRRRRFLASVGMASVGMASAERGHGVVLAELAESALDDVALGRAHRYPALAAQATACRAVIE